MATTKKAAPKKKEETITEKIGHVITDVTESLVETYNKIVHPAPAKKTARKTVTSPAKKTVTQPAKKAVAKVPAKQVVKKAATKKPVAKKAKKK